MLADEDESPLTIPTGPSDPRMEKIGALRFEPIPLRDGRWRAEVTGLSYKIFKSASGFLVDCQRTLGSGAPEVSVHGTPTEFFGSFEAAVEAANAHFRMMMK